MKLRPSTTFEAPPRHVSDGGWVAAAEAREHCRLRHVRERLLVVLGRPGASLGVDTVLDSAIASRPAFARVAAAAA
ncbi:MAG: hypothetical protein ACRD0Z_12325 [Acidimicrobiales bacterium]